MSKAQPGTCILNSLEEKKTRLGHPWLENQREESRAEESRAEQAQSRVRGALTQVLADAETGSRLQALRGGLEDVFSCSWPQGGRVCGPSLAKLTFWNKRLDDFNFNHLTLEESEGKYIWRINGQNFPRFGERDKLTDSRSSLISSSINAKETNHRHIIKLLGNLQRKSE